MNIIPISNYNTNQNNYYLRNSSKSNINFRGTDFLDLPKEDILKRVKESIAPDCFIGNGTDADVYKIKNTQYCVRLPHISSDMCNFDFSKELTSADKVNLVEAKLGFGATIMKIIKGVVPKNFSQNEFARYKFQSKIADMPLSSYTDLLHQIANATDNEMFFDCSGGNLIVDFDNNKFTAIDFYSVTDYPKPVKPLTEMYSVLTSYGSTRAVSQRIFNKIILSGLEEFKPQVIPCMDLALFDFIGLAYYQLSLNKLKSKLENTNQEIKIIDNLTKSVSELKSIKKKEIQNKELAPLLCEKIKEVKKCLKYIK